MTQEEIRRQSLLREQAIAAGMPEDMSAMSPPPTASAASAGATAGLKVGKYTFPGVTQADIEEAGRLADMKIAKSHMAQIEAERQQRIEKQQRDMLESVKEEIARRRVDRAERQFKMAKEVFNKGGDAQELSDRFRLDLLRELSDSFWDETPLAQANTNADSGVWGYSADDLARMKRQEQARRWAEQYNDVAEKMQTSFADAPKFTAQQINAASAGLQQQAYTYTGLDTGLSDQKEAEIRAAYLRRISGQPYPTDGRYDEYFRNEYLMRQIMGPGYKDSYTNFWGLTLDELGAMKQKEEKKATQYKSDWDEQYNDVAGKMETTFADAPKFTAEQINAASAGLQQQAYMGLSAKKEGAPKGLSPTDNWSTEGAAYEKTDDEELTPSQAVEKYRYLIKKYMATNQMDDETMQKFRQGYQTLAYYVFQYDRIPADSRDPAITQELANNADEVAGYLSDMINSISTKKEPEITPAEAENAYWRYRNGISLPGDEKYSRYFPSLANTYEDKEKPGMWGLTERQLDEASLKRRKEIEEASKPNISFEDNTPRTPSGNVERYRKLAQQYIDNPDMDEVTRQALVKELQKGFELLSYYVSQYDNFEPPARDPAITNQLANEAQDVLDFMSNNVSSKEMLNTISNIASNKTLKNTNDIADLISTGVTAVKEVGRVGKAISNIPVIFDVLLLGAEYIDAANKDNWDFGGKKAMGVIGKGIGELIGSLVGAAVFLGSGIATGGIGLAAAAVFGSMVGTIAFSSTGEAIGTWLSDVF